MDEAITAHDVSRKFDISGIQSPEAKAFVENWLTQRELNREFYESVPDDKFDKSFAEGSPSTKDNLIYQIKVHFNYLTGIQEGELLHGKHYAEIEPQLQGLSRTLLLERWDALDREIIAFLASGEVQKLVKVSWKTEPVSAVSAFWGLKDHEEYHLGRNSLMGELLGLPRSANLKNNWG